MSTVDEVKAAAAARLDSDQQYDLFRWWIGSDTFRERQLAALKRDLALGVEDLAAGRYITYDDTNIMQLADDVSRDGRERLKKRGA
jgi:hypothetical protein